MFFLGASANILVYLLFSAFLGLILYTQEKPVPTDYLVSFISATESSEKPQNRYECSIYYEDALSETDTAIRQVVVGIQPSCYISPHYRNSVLYEKALRAPPVLVF